MDDSVLTNNTLDGGQVIEFTDEYKEYLKDLAEGNTAKYGNLIPYAHDPQLPTPPVETRTFAASYDPRSLNIMTQVKDQGYYNGVCWAFASLAALETLQSLHDNVKRNYSEEHHRFFVSTQNPNGFIGRGADDGANFNYSEVYLTNWSGPVNTSDVPYNTSPGGTWNSTSMAKPVVLHPTGTSAIANNQNSMKQAILDFGGMYVSMSGTALNSSTYYNSTNRALYTPTDIGSNHAVFVCGWNDNFATTNFNAGYRPSNNGAWLVKNSWGTGFGDSGYFWMSYQDAVVAAKTAHYAVTDFRDVGISKIESHDSALPNFGLAYSYLMYISNVYDLTSDYNNYYRMISDVMLYTSSIGSTYSIYIVPATSGGEPPAISSLPSPVATGTLTHTGIVTVTLPVPYVIPSAGKYAIIVKQSTGTNGFCNIFMELGDKVTNTNGVNIISAGQSFYSSGSTWSDRTSASTGYTGNYVIRPILQQVSVTTFTPIVKGGTTAGTISLGLARGLCVILGKLKFIHVHVVINAISGSPTGNLQITGSPFTPIYETPLDLGVTSYTGVDLNQRYLTAQILPSGVIEILSCGYGPEQALPVSILAQYATIQLAGCFIATS